jgi:hypothetical protein
LRNACRDQRISAKCDLVLDNNDGIMEELAQPKSAVKPKAKG